MSKVRTLDQAARAVKELGFCLLFPGKKLRLPSLVEAVEGRLLPDYNPRRDWSSEFLRVWKWKDELPRKRLAWYGKYFRGRGTFLAPEFLAYFYRLEGTPGSDDDYARLYRDGRISADARLVCAELLEHGPLGSMELRYALKWEGKRGNQRFQRALRELQSRLVLVHWGTKAETKAWESAVYQFTPRAFPKAVRKASKLTVEDARRRIAAQYRRYRPQVTPRELARLFRWARAEAYDALGG